MADTRLRSGVEGRTLPRTDFGRCCKGLIISVVEENEAGLKIRRPAMVVGVQVPLPAPIIFPREHRTPIHRRMSVAENLYPLQLQ